MASSTLPIAKGNKRVLRITCHAYSGVARHREPRPGSSRRHLSLSLRTGARGSRRCTRRVSGVPYLDPGMKVEMLFMPLVIVTDHCIHVRCI
jgi:hypothetical protein